MNNFAIIVGTFSDFKLIKTRSTAQLVIEVPIERAFDAIAILGIPQPGKEIQVAVYRPDTSEESELA